MQPTLEQIEAAATALVNERVMRNGSPPISNVLDLLPPGSREEVMSDAKAALEALLITNKRSDEDQIRDQKNQDEWGVGNKSDAEAFAMTHMGDGTPVQLIFGEHPHSRRDDREYARFPDGQIEAFDGHRVLIDVNLKSENYLKESYLSGNEVRKGGQCEILFNSRIVYSFFFRDVQRALREADRYIDLLGELPFNVGDAKELNALTGRKVWWERTPAIVDRVILDQGCVVLVPESGEFPPPVWHEEEDNGVWDDDNDSIKAEFFDKKIWWWRK